MWLTTQGSIYLAHCTLVIEQQATADAQGKRVHVNLCLTPKLFTTWQTKTKSALKAREAEVVPVKLLSYQTIYSHNLNSRHKGKNTEQGVNHVRQLQDTDTQDLLQTSLSHNSISTFSQSQTSRQFCSSAEAPKHESTGLLPVFTPKWKRSFINTVSYRSGLNRVAGESWLHVTAGLR